MIDLNSPGTYYHWWIVQVSLANLMVIVVMVVIFGLALLIPFPRPHPGDVEPGPGTATESEDAPPAAPPGPDDHMWTARLRRLAVRKLPPGKALPDRQPAYVASWIYVFGVASLAALAVAVISGLLIALGGLDWWHTDPVGHFFNSLHLWSVELFMALIVIHLWGKFWMASWRGRRKLTWITGVLAFGAAITEALTGYVSQQNFDSQWISTNAKDAFNSVGVGRFFNVMNFGQMILWHVLLIPFVLLLLVGIHVVMVRVRGVAHPIKTRLQDAKSDASEWRGATRRYDILKEGAIASVIVVVIVVVLAALLSSPDKPALTIQTWANSAPADFLATAQGELAGTTETANYGPPYNNGSGSVQQILISPQRWAGIGEPINAPEVFVLNPLSHLSATDPALASAVARYSAASPAQQNAWNTAYSNALNKLTFSGGAPVLPAADDGPVPEMMAAELTLARSGALDTSLLSGDNFYGTDFTKPLLFLEDGTYFGDLATADHLSGNQWGVMNETGSYPGQPWLWLYTVWYQISPFSTNPSVDMIAIGLTSLLTLLLLAIPFLPGLRDIPRWIPLHRLIWRSYYNRGGSPPEVE